MEKWRSLQGGGGLGKALRQYDVGVSSRTNLQQRTCLLRPRGTDCQPCGVNQSGQTNVLKMCRGVEQAPRNIRVQKDL